MEMDEIRWRVCVLESHPIEDTEQKVREKDGEEQPSQVDLGLRSFQY